MYADDNTCTTSHSIYSEAKALEAQADAKLKEWMLANRMTLNVTKTVKMTLSLRDLSMVTNPQSAKMLGVEIDPGMSWEHHCNKLSSSLSTTVFLLKQISRFANAHAVKTAYYGLFHSKMLYGLLAWGHSPHAQSVFGVQRRAMRVLGGAGYRDDFIQLEIPTLYAEYARLCACHVLEANLATPQHNHNTRYKVRGNVETTYNRLSRTQNATNYWAAKVYNKLPAELRERGEGGTCSKVLTKRIKKFFTPSAPYSLQEIIS